MQCQTTVNVEETKKGGGGGGLQISVYIANKKSDCFNSGSLFASCSVFSHWHSLVEEMFFIYYRVALARVVCSTLWQMVELCVLLLTPIESLQILVASSEEKRKIWVVTSLETCQRIGQHRGTNIHLHSHQTGHLKLPVSLMCMLLDCGGNLGRRCADTRSLFTDHDDQFPHSLSKHAV